MNIHEHQAKQILKQYGINVPNGVFALSVNKLIAKAKKLKTKKYVLKAQIHAGGRGKAGGIKILNNIEELTEASKKLLGKTLITPQPPIDINGNVNVSSPDTIGIGHKARILEAISKLPVASLIAIIFGISFHNLATVSGCIVIPQRDGMLYNTMGKSTAAAMA